MKNVLPTSFNNLLLFGSFNAFVLSLVFYLPHQHSPYYKVGGSPLLRKRQIVPSISLTFLIHIYQYNELRTIIISLRVLNIALAVIFYNNLMVINYAKLIVVQRNISYRKIVANDNYTKCLKFNCYKG